MLHQLEVTFDFDAFGVLEVSEQCKYVANSRPGMKAAVLALAGFRAKHMARPLPAMLCSTGSGVVRLGRPTSDPPLTRREMQKAISCLRFQEDVCNDVDEPCSTYTSNGRQAADNFQVTSRMTDTLKSSQPGSLW